ncbi:MAG: hypothetical protein V1918_07465, partial [Planctomycetota bacterium]
MSKATKVFIVLNFLLSFLFAVLSLNLYANKIDWYAQAKTISEDRAKLYKSYEELSRNSKNERTKFEIENQGFSKELYILKPAYEEAKARIEVLTQNNTSLAGDVNSFKDELARTNTMIQKTLLEKKTTEEALDSLREAYQTAQSDRDFAQKSAIELSQK